MPAPCCVCGCTEPTGSTVHALAGALLEDDLDRAIESGLLDCTACPQCDPACTVMLLASRDERLRALAARERYQAREARLQRRAAERAARRAPPATPDASAAARPALPSAAVAALARAKARAAERRRS